MPVTESQADLRKIERIFDMIRLIHDPRMNLTVYDLAGRYETDLRTVRRDLCLLNALGYGFRKDSGRNGRRRVLKFSAEAPLLPPLGFTFHELAALYATRRIYAFLKGSHFQKAATSALEKIESCFGAETAERLEDAVQVKTGPVRDYSRHHDIIRDLSDAVVARRCVSMGYRSGAGRRHDAMVLRPYSLIFYSNAVYALGYSENHGCVRTFAVERVTGLRVLERTFDRPENLGRATGIDDHFGIYSGNVETVRLRVGPDYKNRIKDKILHPTQSLVFKNDGSMHITFRAAGKEDLFKWLLSQGGAVELVSPEGWREEFRSLLAKMGGAYANN